MSWLTLVLYSKKIWVWCKHHWKILALALWTLVVFLIARKNVRAYKKVLDTTIENYKKEVEVLENSHKEEIRKRDEAIKRHNDDIKKLEEKYAGDKEELDVEKRSRYLELVKMYKSDPESINKILEEEFGFKYEE
jgi:flagellar biosynthesis/type III secretory pathway M-ring protein FliF/YscJ|tara:strand:- start:419 stop:823 length:405 start_codon:yes stop_codon:yes gene_type:complete